MRKKDKLNRLLTQFELLLDILKKEGTSETSYAIDQLESIISVLYLPHNHKEAESILKEISVIYQSLYPPRGGLTDFFIWRENYEERFALNKNMRNIEKKIKNILSEE